MNYRTANVAAVLCCLSLIAATLLAWQIARDATAEALPAAPAITEDDPRWNWTLHGNGRRTVVTLDGTQRTVTVCGFNRLWAHGAIRYRALKRLRGDYFARTLTDCPWRIREARPYPWRQSPTKWAEKRGY